MRKLIIFGLFSYTTVIDLLEKEGCNDVIDDDCFHSNQLALFTQLFLDEHKMQVGELMNIYKCLNGLSFCL